MISVSDYTRTYDGTTDASDAIDKENFLLPVIAESIQPFAWISDGTLALVNKGIHVPRFVPVKVVAHQFSSTQHESRQNKSDVTLKDAIEQTDLAIGTEIAETDRESGAGQENLASDTGTAGGADESAEESDEKKKR